MHRHYYRPALTALALCALAAASPAAPGDLLVKSLKVLMPIYRGEAASPERLSDADVAGIEAAADRARLFYFRNTSGTLNLEVCPLLIDAPAPENQGPTYDHIEKDLAARGIAQGQYDGVFTTGVGLTGNWGGFVILGDMGAAFGMPDRRGGLTWYPENDPTVWYGLCWTFVHEFQHALEGPICGEWLPEMLSGHPYSDSAESHFTWGHQGAQHFSWEACTLREMGKRLLLLPGARREWLTVKDTDGDGLADQDARLPVDEARFGSDPTKADTDGDGLDDLHEFTADIFLGSSPVDTDSDRDGQPDGEDAWPSVAIAPTVRYAADADLVVDGEADACYAPLLSRVIVASDPALAEARVDACWNEDGLYLFLRNAPASGFEMEIDSSAENGYWEGGDTYLIRATADGKVGFAGLGLSGPVPGATSARGPDGLEVHLPALIGQGVSNEINWGGARRKEDVTDGLRLLGGRSLGLNLVLVSASGRALFMPNFQVFTTALRKESTDPANPTLRFGPRLTREAQPTVVVTGAGAADRVEVVSADGTTLGERLGNGPVILTGPLHEGGNALLARAGGHDSAPVTLVVDTSAEPPTATRASDGTLALRGEPGATAEVFVGDGTFPMLALASVTLDAEGAASAPLAADFRGFLGAYARGIDFGEPAFYRVDRAIQYDYEDRTCDPRLPAEGFCIVWTGTLTVPTDGEYTFYLATDDGSRLYLDGLTIINEWGHHEPQPREVTLKLTAGPHALRMLYYEEYGWASAHLEWSGPGIARTHELPVTALPLDPAAVRWLVRQTDPAGNVSRFGEVE
jgi:hypothetical protein